MENGLVKTSNFLQEQENSAVENGVTMQRMQTKYATAVSVQKPRNLDKIVEKVKIEAEFAGETFFYAWGEGKDHIEGNSVALALTVVREWGNCALETEVKEEKDSYIFSAHFVDLETGFTLSRSFRQSKNSKVYGKLDDVRKDDIRFQIGQSKSIRNVINNVMPRWLMDDAREIAKKSVENNITKDGIAIAIEKAISALNSYGVSEDRILAKLEKSKNQLVMADIVDLRTAYAAIKNGEATAETIFPKGEESETAPSAGTAKFAPAVKPDLNKPNTPAKTFEEYFSDKPITAAEMREYIAYKNDPKINEETTRNIDAINHCMDWIDARNNK